MSVVILKLKVFVFVDNLFPHLVSLGEKLGKAAFAFTIVILIGIIAGLGWFCWERSGNKLSTSNAPKKGKDKSARVKFLFKAFVNL